MARVLIAGCGYVGAELGSRLAAAGHAVWGMKRRPVGLPSGVRPVAADLTNPGSLGNLPSDLDVVVYAASADSFAEDAYRRAYVDGPRHLLAALATQGQSPRRVLLVSSTSVYGQRRGEWVDEDSPTEPAGFNGRLVLEGEEAVRGGPFPATVVRFGGLYGPGRVLFVGALRAGTATCSESPPACVNLVHRDDGAGALAHLSFLPDAAPVYIVVDSCPAERCELLRWLAARLGLPPPAVVDAGPGPRGQGFKRCSSRRLLGSGYELAYPSYVDGFSALC